MSLLRVLYAVIVVLLAVRRAPEPVANLRGAGVGSSPLQSNVSLSEGGSDALVASKSSYPFNDIAGIKETLPDKILDAYSDAYKELSDNWRGLETKAQGNIAIAGIFIAGAFAFIQKISPELNLAEKVMLVAALFFLIMSVILAVRALRVQIVPAPLFGRFVEGSVKRLLLINDEAEFNRRFTNFINDYAVKWQNVLLDLSEQLHNKASDLEKAQAFLIGAILVVALFAASKVVL